jgi:hypothetical protein
VGLATNCVRKSGHQIWSIFDFAQHIAVSDLKGAGSANNTAVVGSAVRNQVFGGK